MRLPQECSLEKAKWDVPFCRGISSYSEEKKEQIDVLIRLWDQTVATVKTRKIILCSLGHTCAEDLASTFREATEDIKKTNIPQVSMDGLNTNLKCLRSLRKELQASSTNLQIVDIGRCKLEVVNGAFKTGHSAMHWDLAAFPVQVCASTSCRLCSLHWKCSVPVEVLLSNMA